MLDARRRRGVGHRLLGSVGFMGRDGFGFEQHARHAAKLRLGEDVIDASQRLGELGELVDHGSRELFEVRQRRRPE
jgi:hypothetical protein